MAFTAPTEDIQNGFTAPDNERVSSGFVAPDEERQFTAPLHEQLPRSIPMGNLGTANLSTMPASPSDDLAKLNQVTSQVASNVPYKPLTDNTGDSFLPPPVSKFIAKWSLPGQAKQLIDRFAPNSQASKVAGGITDTTQDTLDFFTSPMGIISLGTGELPVAAQRAVAGGVAAYMAKQIPDQYGQLKKAIAAGDTRQASRIASGAAINAFGTVAGGKFALKGHPMPITPETPSEAVPPMAKSPTQPAAAPPPAAPVASKPLGTVGDQIGAKLDEIKALLSQQNQPKEANEQVQQTGQKAVAPAERNEPERVGGVSGTAISGQKEIPSESSGGEAQVAPSGSSAEDITLKPDTFGKQYPAVALKVGDKVYSGKPPDIYNHADLAEQHGFPENSVPGFLDNKGNFVYQYEEDVPKKGTQNETNPDQQTGQVQQVAKPSESVGPAPVREVPPNPATETGAAPVEAGAAEPLNPGGSLASLTPELQAKSNAVKDAMKAQFEALKAQKPPKSPEDTLSSASTVKLNLPEGATQIRVTTSDGKTAVRPLTQINKGDNPFRGVDIAKIEAGTIGKDKKFSAMAGDVQVVDKTPVKVLGFGGGVSEGETPIANTPQELSNVVEAHTPGLEAVSGAKQGIQSLVLPSAKSAEHLTAAEDLGARLGAMNHRAESAAEQLRAPGKQFDRLGVHNEKLAPIDNPGIKFMSDLSQGRPVEPRFEEAAKRIQSLFDDRVQKLEQAGAPINKVRENYFPGMWTRESREALNAAMADANKEGIIGEGTDVNDATKEQKQWVKERVDQYLEQGKGSDKDMLVYFTKQPMKGSESFRKQKVFDDIMTGAEFGLRPISNNPIDLVKGKLAEMDKSIMANQFFQEQQAKGKLKVISPYEEVPEGWTRINDKYGTIYGKPTVDISEHVDKSVYEGLSKAADILGIKHERSMKFPAGKNQSALGLSYQGQDLVRTKFATETSVLAHEIGHQLDHKYDLWKEITGGEKGNERKSDIQKDLRAIADMTENRGGKTRSKEEKIAQMVEAYVHAPEAMKEAAPTVFAKFDKFIKSNPDLAGIADIKPGIALKKLTSEKYVGMPIMGYRIVPEAVGDVINNYLSSSLYNNKYFGGLYKAWMGTANALNQSQLGLGSAFHAGFTTLDAQVSAGANVLKDVYGVMLGNRSFGDLADTAKKFVTASISTSMKGDKVLNAWRNPNAPIDPKVAQIVKATELAGGAYHMERGLQTEQSTKVVRDWFSGNRVKAVARTPVALTELMAKPIMQYLVPRQKAGVFAELASRIIEQNPETPIEDLKPQFRQAWNRVDARLGQVVYDRLFMNNTAKNVIQGLIRAPGWTGGTIAELGGAFPDAAKFVGEWTKTGKAPANIPDRAAYALSLITTMAAANGVLTYAFTGQTPKGMDFLAFRSGKKDKQGNDERFLLPSYVKDLIAYWQHPGQTLLNKTHPLISMVKDVAQNRDYYGYEIRNPHDNMLAQSGQVAKYVVKQFEPFWIRGVQENVEQKSGAMERYAPLIGVMPGTANINRSAIQNRIAELYYQRTGEPLKPYGQRESDAEKQAKIYKTPLDVYQYNRLPYSDKVALRKDMTAQEQAKYPMPKPPKPK